jgi:hypothetical protein
VLNVLARRDISRLVACHLSLAGDEMWQRFRVFKVKVFQVCNDQRPARCCQTDTRVNYPMKMNASESSSAEFEGKPRSETLTRPYIACISEVSKTATVGVAASDSIAGSIAIIDFSGSFGSVEMSLKHHRRKTISNQIS